MGEGDQVQRQLNIIDLQRKKNLKEFAISKNRIPDFVNLSIIILVNKNITERVPFRDWI